MRVDTRFFVRMVLTGLLTVAGSQLLLATELDQVEVATDLPADADVGPEVPDGPAAKSQAQVVTSPKFKCKPVNALYGSLGSTQATEVDLMCPGSRFVTVAQCSQAGPPILNTLSTPLPFPQQSWVNYLIVNPGGFARGVHCRVLSGQAMASAMCCANF